MNKSNPILADDAIALLKKLIATPSFSKEEKATAMIIRKFLEEKGIAVEQVGNNIWAKNKFFDASKPNILLNSHHDTVKPNPKYTRDPFLPEEYEGKLYGLGSNDAGGCLVSLIALFQDLYNEKDARYNFILAATAEEEISGSGGIEMLLPHLPPIDHAIVGEPTQMQMAIAERGLMVLDAINHGKAGHAARNEGHNAIYEAMQDIQWFRTFHFQKVSPLLGPSRMNVTVIETENKAHNMVPSVCSYVVDVRLNEEYSFEEALTIIRQHVKAEITPRSTRLRSTIIPQDHVLVKSGLAAGREIYGSPTTSDKALMPFPALKMGPGDSARSHTADEYIYIQEIREAIPLYRDILNRYI
jgi:acetylornithine deacetylase